MKSSTNDLTYEILPDDHQQYDFNFKLIVIGDSGVGKSCLSIKATKNLFENNYNTTVGFEFFTFNVKINDKVVKLQIWDTCGQEIYRSLITNFYRNSSLAIVVYSIDNRESFENVDSWLKEIKNNSNPDIKVFMIGNKTDLEDRRKVNIEDAEKYKQAMGFDLFMEASAKTGFNAKNRASSMSSVVSKNRNVETQRGTKLKAGDEIDDINVKKSCKC